MLKQKPQVAQAAWGFFLGADAAAGCRWIHNRAAVGSKNRPHRVNPGVVLPEATIGCPFLRMCHSHRHL